MFARILMLWFALPAATLVAALVLYNLGLTQSGDPHGDEPSKTVVGDGVPFADDFQVLTEDRWNISDGWRNGDWTVNDWRRSSVSTNGDLTITLAPSRFDLAAFSSGEVQSDQRYGHGYFEVDMKVAKGSGIVTGFFTYTGPAFGTRWDEIDIEVLGSRPTEVMLTYFRDGRSQTKYVSLGFDSSAGFHRYGFDWQAEAITWYVDGQPVHRVDGEGLALPTLPQKLMISLWGSTTLTDWLGRFDPETLPVSATVRCISYSPNFATHTPCELLPGRSTG